MDQIEDRFQPFLRDIVVEALKNKLRAKNKNPEDFVKEAMQQKLKRHGIP